MQLNLMEFSKILNSPDRFITDEMVPLIKSHGFREYDARWWYGFEGCDQPCEINLAGVQALGLALAHMMRLRGIDRSIVVGHDLRCYSQEVKSALIAGLLSGGAQIYDIGLALSPIAYFAQFALNVRSVAMVTASHNENGWTGVKIGCERPYTFGINDMAELRAIVFENRAQPASGGSYQFVDTMAARYAEALTRNHLLKRRLKVVVACGNGTAGMFAPQILREIGCEVIELDCTPDWTFPKYNPDPEAAPMQRAMVAAVLKTQADLALGFDGDGDRCGIVDNEGSVIFSDRIGLLLAREFSQNYPRAHFVVDVKSTGLFGNDAVLKANGATVEYWKTGHSYIKRRLGESGGLAGFEKSGHVFLAPPLGLGYDDGLATAIAVCKMLASHSTLSMAELHRQLPKTFATPTRGLKSCDSAKYIIIRQIEACLSALVQAGGMFAGQAVIDLLTINGVRITVADGTWGLIRASSNKPELVVVAESPVSSDQLNAMLAALNEVLQKFEAGKLPEHIEYIS